ncbi:MAG: FadR family transcriptional regulator [Burkholderiales bacterium]|nr:FadR family transcriptional regulator [Burkholderiales bacterium]
MLELKPITVPKAADVLADTLREKILKSELAEGAELPSERDLCERAGLSRATVREALRILESEGLIATRLGRYGGSTVARPSAAAIERSVGIFIRGQRIRFEAVLETRAAIEPPSARFGALHRTEADLEEMEACQARLVAASEADDLPGYVRANLDWHVQVVRSSHNELLIAFMQAVAQSVYLATDLDGFNSVAVRKAVIQAHRRVIDAIRAGDGDAAARRMERHVGAYIDGVRTTTAAAAK